MSLGQRIQHRRVWLNIGVEEFAQKVGVNRTQVWRWESGEAEPSLSRLRTVAKILGCSVKSLLPGDKEAA